MNTSNTLYMEVTQLGCFRVDGVSDTNISEGKNGEVWTMRKGEL